MTSVVAVVLVLGGLILFHELGHFLVARALGIGVKTFSLGFGPRLCGIRRGRTDYRVSLLPLGGYVSLVGETDQSDLPEGFTTQESFALRPPWHRMLVIAAGPVTNILLALLLCMLIYLAYGRYEALPIIGQVTPDGPAAMAGMLPQDRILEIDGRKIEYWDDFRDEVQTRGEQPLHVVVEREAGRLSLTMTPKLTPQSDIFGQEVMVPVVGVYSSGEVVNLPMGLYESISQGFYRTWQMLSLTVIGLGKLIDRTVPLDTVGGPVQIAQLIVEQSQVGLAPLLALAAFISINLGLLNLLPIPILDGGHLLFLVIEAIRRKPISERIQGLSMQIGLVLLLLVFVLVMYNDIAKLIWPAPTP